MFRLCTASRVPVLKRISGNTRSQRCEHMGHELVQERRAAWFNRTECHHPANRDAQKRVVTFEHQPTAPFYLLVSEGIGSENQPPQPRFILAYETLSREAQFGTNEFGSKQTKSRRTPYLMQLTARPCGVRLPNEIRIWIAGNPYRLADWTTTELYTAE